MPLGQLERPVGTSYVIDIHGPDEPHTGSTKLLGDFN